jgi:hypothetical protein
MNDPTNSAWRPNGGRKITDPNVGWVPTAPMPDSFLYDDNEDSPDLFSDGDSMSNTKQNVSHQRRSAFGSMLDPGSVVSIEGENYPTTRPQGVDYSSPLSNMQNVAFPSGDQVAGRLRTQGWANVDYSSPLSNMQNVTFPSGDQVAGRLRTAPVSDFTSPTNAAGRGHVAWSLGRVSNTSLTSFKPRGDRPISLSKRRIIGDGIVLREERQKARSSLIHKLAEEKRIRKKTGTARRSLLNALNLIEQLRGELDGESDVFSRLALPISQLEESVGEELLRQTRAGLPSSTAEEHSRNIDFANHSAADSYSFGDTASMSATSGFSLQHQTGSLTSVTSCEESNGEEYSMDIAMETPRAQQPTTPVYHCTFESNGMLCNFTTKFRCDWIRHEESEKHWPQKRYMCLLCIEVMMDDEGRPQCKFCSERLPAFGDNKAHYLQCEKARNKGRHIFAAARDEHFRTHLRRFHAKQGIDAEAATWNFTVQSKWPKQCGFCPHRFAVWEERSSHIALHFEQGMDISSWKPQSRKPKRLGDHRPGIDHHKRDDDDDDDDDDENHYPDHGSGNGYRQEYSMSYTSSASSPQQANSTQSASNEWRGWVWSGSFGSDSKEDISRTKVEKYLQEQVQILGNTVPDIPSSPAVEAFDLQLSFEIETPDEFDTVGTNAIDSRRSFETQASNETDTVETMFNMPARNPHFYARCSLLEDMNKVLAPKKINARDLPIYAIHGLGGVGKTQLALEYAHKHSRSYDFVFWINGETSTTVEESFSRIAKTVGVETDRNVPDDNLQATRPEKSYGCQKKSWLLVFDNADESLSALDQFWSSALVKTSGSILITSRAKVNLEDLGQWSTHCQLSLQNLELTRIESEEIPLPWEDGTPCEDVTKAKTIVPASIASWDISRTTNPTQASSKDNKQRKMIASRFGSYSPLTNSDSIRLITLYPAENSGSQLRCDLTTSRLSEAPAYEALSYCWGSRVSSDTLETSTGHIKISENLASALRAVRSHHPKLLWVDTLCINQADRSERYRQIQMMSEIYNKAAQVAVYLGTHEDNLYGEAFLSMFPSDSPKVQPLYSIRVIQPKSLDLDSLKQMLSSRSRHSTQYFKSLVTLIKNHNMDSTLLNLYFAGNSLIGMQGGFNQEEFLRVWSHWLQLSLHMDSLERIQTRPAQCQFPRCSYSKLLNKFGESVSYKGPCRKQLVSQPQGYIEVDNEDDEMNGETSLEI